jgi:hypothetical protein
VLFDQDAKTLPGVVQGGFKILPCGFGRLKAVQRHRILYVLERAGDLLIENRIDLIPFFILSQGGSHIFKAYPTLVSGKQAQEDQKAESDLYTGAYFQCGYAT